MSNSLIQLNAQPVHLDRVELITPSVPEPVGQIYGQRLWSHVGTCFNICCETVKSIASRIVGSPLAVEESGDLSERAEICSIDGAREVNAEPSLVIARESIGTFNPVQSKKPICCLVRKIAFRVFLVFKAVLLFLVSISFFLSGCLIVWFPPSKKLGLELLMNGVFVLKLVTSMFKDSLGKFMPDHVHLLSGEQGVFQSEFAWYLNLGLLREAYDKTDDPALKKQIEFLAVNYLAKAASYNTEKLRYLNPNVDEMTQISPIDGANYHRWCWRDQLDHTKKFNQELSFGDESPLILTDTVDLAKPFAVGFTVLTPENSMIDSLKGALDSHFAKNSSDPLKTPFPCLFDLTTLFEDCMYDKGSKKEAKIRLETFQSSIKQLMEDVSQKYPQINKEKLKLFIKENTTCISRVSFSGISGIKLLPLEPNCSGKDLLTRYSTFCEFIDSTGLYINRLSFYRHVLSDVAFRGDTRYVVDGPKGVHYFKQIEDLTANLTLFEAGTNPEVQILGNATIQLLKGWVDEVGQAKWETICENPVLREILDGSLYKIKLLLASAKLSKDDYSTFNQSIELIHNELAMLLELTTPFESDEFSHIYLAKLQTIPASLKARAKAGIAKTAMNVYTGIHSAIRENLPEGDKFPVRTYCDGLYFEEAGFIGKSHSLEDLLKDPTITTVDLYSTQFNSNIQVDAAHTNYQVVDVEGDVRKLLASKPGISQLTVSVDCTIDYFNSPKLSALLKAFESEIEAGKLNFVFLRSGQKFEMFGMDNYYGSPYYIVNNGGSKWDSFNGLLTESAYQTDSLSTQWFCLTNLYASELLDSYRKQVFENTRKLLAQVPTELLPQGDPLLQRMRINTVHDSMEPAFIDIKLMGASHQLRSRILMGQFHQRCAEKGIKSDSRSGFGFFHPNIVNISVNAISSSSSLRITPGLNEEENQVIVEFFQDLLDKS